MKSKRLHSTSIVVEDIGVLIIGEPGAGKSDLAMRLIDSGATLISDDLTICKKISNSILYLYTPPEIKGLIEIKEKGLLTVPFIDGIRLSLVVELSNDKIEDKSENCSCKIMGVKIPKIIVNSKNSELESSVKIKLNKMRHYA